ncbi:Glucan 1,3-beta-glucosidase 3 [Aspergillus nanangensis]|uniref:Glucan 1,3-beta-glucosidase 3 n=1 Tax=Aspergillus nanangensis TaxID=2582783 RepID=A0AAD4GZW4_ASPNN|nr:Glucan 1,3-beta-glucosidase 3 [Aspergillus nanangensis]
MNQSVNLPPTVDDIFRYRYQHGTNVGPIFMHGPWFDRSISEEDIGGRRELEKIQRSLKDKGLNETKSNWESHWLNALTEDDLMWLRDVAHCNLIRLPVGFFTLGPLFCSGTVFDGEPSQVYTNCWNTIRHLLSKCYDYGIGVLIDFQTIPRGLKAAPHKENSHDSQTCPSPHSWVLARDCVAFIVQEVTFHAMSEVVGIQISSDTNWGTCDLQKWYDEVLEITSCINPSLPTYISDGQDLPAALDLAMLKNKFTAGGSNSPIIVDTHRYYTAGSYRSMDPMTIIEKVHNELAELESRPKNVISQGTAVDVFIGEYSCAIDSQAWRRTDPSEQLDLTKAFGQAQVKLWASKACGSAFCGFKTSQDKNDAWSFEKQVHAGVISAPTWRTIPSVQILENVKQAESQWAQIRDRSLSEVSTALDASAVQRFTKGWDLGYSDALSFLGAIARGVMPGSSDGGDKIGAMELWVRKRIIDTQRLDTELGIEWETGLRQGIADFYNSTGI